MAEGHHCQTDMQHEVTTQTLTIVKRLKLDPVNDVLVGEHCT